jgi:DNA polymerase
LICAAARDFASWRENARLLLARNTPPEEILWSEQASLLSAVSGEPAASLSLPRSFVATAEVVARHRDPRRWSVLYRIAWRILNENRHLMAIESDEDVRALARMRKAVETDIYKMRAFVRFRRVMVAGTEQFVAWYAPDHDTLEVNAQFFVDRFGGMRWSILSPTLSLSWDLKTLHRGPGVPRSEAPAEDELEHLFRA